MQQARYYTNLGDGRIRCNLCPHYCALREGERGLCLSRAVHSGHLISENYGKVTALSVDPVEKKPLYHFFPGNQILSVGTFGCNLECSWCQNCEISRHGKEAFTDLPVLSPEMVVKSAVSSGGIGLAYTYNEPSVWFEYMLDMAVEIKEAGLKNVVVTNGYINKQPLDELLRVAHAFNVDLKGFSELFYSKRAGGKLKPVLKTLQEIKKKGVHLEVTFLVIPGYNDHPVLFEDMVRWIADELGHDTVLHISRYYPAYHLKVAATPASVMTKLNLIAKRYLLFVYAGNIHASAGFENSTRCPFCGELLVERHNYNVIIHEMSPEGSCSKCGKKIFVNS